MTERDDRAEGGDPSPEPHPGLPSARERAPVGDREGGSSRRERGQRGGRDAFSRPKPARELTRPDPEPPPDEEPERALSVGEERWTVRVLGRAGGTSGVRTAPLLLLGFSRDGAPSREALVVGRELGGLTDDALERALAGARQEAEAKRGEPAG